MARRPDSSNRQIILITTVDIGEGRTDQIQLREGDSPQVLHLQLGRPTALQLHTRQNNQTAAAGPFLPAAPLHHTETTQHDYAYARVVSVMQDAALAFCEDHGLDRGIAGPLARHIQGNLERANQDVLAQVGPDMHLPHSVPCLCHAVCVFVQAHAQA